MGSIFEQKSRQSDGSFIVIQSLCLVFHVPIILLFKSDLLSSFEHPVNKIRPLHIVAGGSIHC